MSIKRPDLLVTPSYDLVFDHNSMVTTNKVSEQETLSQVIYICLKSISSDFLYRTRFGASPKVFSGQPLSRFLIGEIERHVALRIRNSEVLPANTEVSVRAVPISRSEIAMRVLVSLDSGNYMFDMIYNTTDNTVNRVNGYGA